jgi:hypothetical protein
VYLPYNRPLRASLEILRAGWPGLPGRRPCRIYKQNAMKTLLRSVPNECNISPSRFESGGRYPVGPFIAVEQIRDQVVLQANVQKRGLMVVHLILQLWYIQILKISAKVRVLRIIVDWSAQQQPDFFERFPDRSQSQRNVPTQYIVSILIDGRPPARLLDF